LSQPGGDAGSTWPRTQSAQIRRDNEFGNEVLRNLGQHVRFRCLLEPPANNIGNVALECIGDLDFHQVLPGAVEVQDAAPIAPLADAELRKLLGGGFLNGPAGRKVRQKDQGVLDA